MNRHLRLPEWSHGVLGLIAVFGALEVAARTEILPSRHFPPISETLRTLGAEIARAAFWGDLASTLKGWGLGLFLASVVAVPLGIVVGSNPLLYRSLRVPIEFLRPIPSVAVIPLVVLVFGSGLESKIFLVAFASFWPLLIHAIYGAQDADPIARDTARAFGLRRVARFTRVNLPSAAPYVATGLRLASSIALILAVTTELLIGGDGLGRAIAAAQAAGAVEVTYALVVVTGIVGWGLNAMFSRAERRVLHWHFSHRYVRAEL